MLSRVWSFLGPRKKYWLLPLVIVVVVFGALVVVSQRSDTGPFHYSF
jgi:hypothetical protein